MQATSFPPLIPDSRARLLILGSMPGRASLEAGEYYAFRQNAFWPILVAIADGGKPDRDRAFALDYARRCARLSELGIVLWDVLESCVRPGSLDASIERDSEVPNRIDALLDAHDSITRVLFNGAAAETLFRRHFGKADGVLATIERRRLPSTSPAHASLSLDAKFDAWREAIREDSAD